MKYTSEIIKIKRRKLAKQKKRRKIVSDILFLAVFAIIGFFFFKEAFHAFDRNMENQIQYNREFIQESVNQEFYNNK